MGNKEFTLNCLHPINHTYYKHNKADKVNKTQLMIQLYRMPQLNLQDTDGSTKRKC